MPKAPKEDLKKTTDKTGEAEKFSDKIERLDETLRRLDDRNLPFDESLDLFERGVSLVKEARAYLEKAEQRVTLLTREGEETDFKASEDKPRLAE
ncbi:hypothetical protein FACS1894187_20070 [Synergistales bacterium]|nr:hypothetical protein FACS1894187_20070 [Synergistales bacterium]